MRKEERKEKIEPMLVSERDMSRWTHPHITNKRSASEWNIVLVDTIHISHIHIFHTYTFHMSSVTMVTMGMIPWVVGVVSV